MQQTFATRNQLFLLALKTVAKLTLCAKQTGGKKVVCQAYNILYFKNAPVVRCSMLIKIGQYFKSVIFWILADLFFKIWELYFMKAKNLRLRGMVTVCITLALSSISNLSAAACPISMSSLAGSWSFNESGTDNLFGHWSEIGSFTLNSSGKGSGIAIITAAEANLVAVSAPLNSIQVTGLDGNCIGTAIFSVSLPGLLPPQQRFVMITVSSGSSFDYISTTGDQTTVGHATKRATSNTQ